MPSGTLYLIPVPISETDLSLVVPNYNSELVNSLTNFIAEDAKNARRFLKQCNYADISKAEIAELNEHTKSNSVSELIKPLIEGKNVGLLSDAGCPGIADPGADVVKLAHQKNIVVKPLIGPSSIVLSIMASGFNGQNFAFVGYLPIEKPQRSKRIKELESLALKSNQAQFFIETPYRNGQLFDDLIQTLQPETLLFIGINLTSSSEKLVSKSVKMWKQTPKPDFHKIPAVFGIYR
ncbi:MAG: SAM-dependent methyltransferase [Bacteroidetes bacterium]|nr:SAM-dependent methyltransferase [Bacteroidota bacterium]